MYLFILNLYVSIAERPDRNCKEKKRHFVGAMTQIIKEEQEKQTMSEILL